MKRQFVLFVCLVFAFATLNAKDDKKGKETTTFVIEEMDCDHCVKKIEKNISFEKGVSDIKCDLPTKTVVVTYKKDKTTKTKLVDAFKKIKMTAKVVEKEAIVKSDSTKVKTQVKSSDSTQVKSNVSKQSGK